MVTDITTIYVAYHKDDFVSEGTLEEVAEKTGFTTQTIKAYAYRQEVGKRKGKEWSITRYKGQYLERQINRQKLKAAMIENHCSIEILADTLNIKPMSLISKACGLTSFSEDEINKMEYLFQLEKGELIE